MILTALRALLSFTIVAGFIYPLVVFGLSQTFFRHAADGSLIERQGKIVGSELIGQKFQNPRYLQGRPSASDFATLPAGASNLGPTSAKLATFVATEKARWGTEVPSELLFTSGSGLDPHVSPSAARIQVDRIARERHLNEGETRRLQALVDEVEEGPELGFLGPERVNVLRFNLLLDERFP